MTVRISAKGVSRDFMAYIEKVSGQNVNRCIQCGNCSASCPMTDHMDVFPRKVTRLAQLGLRETLEGLGMYWVCASCLNCGVVCPRGIDLPRLMEALRLMTLRKNINHIEPSELSPDILVECPQIALVAAFRKATS